MSTPSTVEVRPLADLSHTVLLAGAGKMGGALLQGWFALGLSPEKVAVIEPQPSTELAALSRQGLRLNPSRDVIGAVAAVVAAVKPQIAPEVVPALAPFVGGGTVVVSIMAGRTLAFLSDSLPRAALVRAMPNTPAAIGRGITVAGAGELLHRSPLDPATLRQNVTSPGGTTAAALEVLMAEGGLEPLMTAAIAAATKRSRDLAG